MDCDLLLIVPLAFVCELIDSGLGMGYGTLLSPILVLAGYNPLQIVPVVLLSEFLTGLLAAGYHHNLRNVHFHLKSNDTKVASVLSAFSVVGAVVAALVAVRLPARVAKVIVGGIVFSMGIIILATWNRKPRFSWKGIISLGAVASFNKGLSGGGYGPLVMGGQILSGVGVKNAVGITSLAESMTCLVGLVTYFLCGTKVDWNLAPYVVVGALLSVPFAAHIVRRVTEHRVKFAVASVTLILGALTFYKALT